ncbi:Uncharacterised protein [uncultured archaeon]|nr:Uncharacterised protein [uncultured archaeon]
MKLPQGAHVVPECAENFYDICRNIKSSFRGYMTLSTTLDNQEYVANLLFDSGNVTAASVVNYATQKNLSGNEALEAIKNKLAGSKGGLELYTLSATEFKKATDDNPADILTPPVPITDLHVKIKATIIKPPKSGLLSKIKNAFSFHSGRSDEIQRLDKKPAGIAVEEEPKKETQTLPQTPRPQFAFPKIPSGPIERQQKNIPYDQPRPQRPLPQPQTRPTPPRQSDTPPATEPQASTQEKTKEEEYKRQLLAARNERVAKIAQQQKEPPKPITPTIQPTAGTDKVQTTIDRLYRHVQMKGRAPLNETTAHQLGITKTQLEEWAIILEEHNLIELHYPTIGEPEIIRKKT